MIFWSYFLAFGIIQFSNGHELTGATQFNSSSTEKNSSVLSEIDFEALSLFEVSPRLAEELRENLLKAIEAAEKPKPNGLRQDNGGISGGYYQQGGGPDEDDDDENTGPATAGPGLFGILSGLFGVASGIGMRNPTRIIQSAVNFFPPSRRMQAQMIVDSLIGYVPPENRTLRPRPRTPPTRPTELYSSTNLGNTTGRLPNSNVSAGLGKDPMSLIRQQITTMMPLNMLTSNVSSPIPSTTPNEDDEDDIDKPDPTTTRKSVNALAGSNSTVVPSTTEEDEYDLDKEDATTTQKPLNTFASSNATATPVLSTTLDEDDEDDIEKVDATTTQRSVSLSSDKVTTVPTTTPNDEDEDDIDKPDTTTTFKPPNYIAGTTIPTTTPNEDEDYDGDGLSLYSLFKPESNGSASYDPPRIELKLEAKNTSIVENVTELSTGKIS